MIHLTNRPIILFRRPAVPPVTTIPLIAQDKLAEIFDATQLIVLPRKPERAKIN